jgi:dolichol-phosphate mannosyltransferase
MIINKEKNFISAVVYTHNNEKIIAQFIDLLVGILDTNFEKYEIICVNDASNDNTTSLIKEKTKQSKDGIISIVNMSYYQGLEPAMNAGVDLAIGDFVFEFDTVKIDYDQTLIMDVYWRSLEGYDIVSASNNTRRKFTSLLFYFLFNKNSGMQYKLTTESFRLVSRRAINRTHAMSSTIPYRKALYANCGLKNDVVIYQSIILNHLSGYDQWNEHRWETAFSSLILFTNVAYRLSMLMTAIMMFATLSGVIYTIIIFALGKPVEGYTTTMFVITAAFFAVFAILAIIIKYLSVLINLVFKKQGYTVESVEKVTRQ